MCNIAHPHPINQFISIGCHFNLMFFCSIPAVVGILSIVAQLVLGCLMRVFGAKRTIILGLFFEMMQMLWYGFGSQTW